MDIPGKGVIVRNYESWSITLSRKSKKLSIETLDYHAGPLVLTRDELGELARIMGLRVGKKKSRKKERTDAGT